MCEAVSRGQARRALAAVARFTITTSLMCVSGFSTNRACCCTFVVLLASRYVLYVCVFFTFNRAFYPSNIQHNQCPCRSFNPINRRDTSSVVVVTKLRHRDTTLPRARYQVCSEHSSSQKYVLVAGSQKDILYLVLLCYYGGPFCSK